MTRNSAAGLSSIVLAVVIAGVFAFAGQEPPQMTAEEKAEMDAYVKAATPGAEHQWLASQVGTYDLKIRNWHDAGSPPVEDNGTSKRTMMLDGRVLVEDITGTLMGTPYTGHGLSGYDNVTGKYWGTWTDSLSTGLVISEGTCDAKKVCTNTAGWNDPITKAPVKARIVSRWPSPTTEIFEMFGKGRDGKEMKTMEITYTKK
jgi:uncharacterized protein DUF1579